jgi:Protein of unknown function (DUF3300)
MKTKSVLQSGMSGMRRGRTFCFLILLLSFCLTGFLQAQEPPPEQPEAPTQGVPRQLSPEELNELLAPIALYPDALVALILPASTMPSEVVLAARYISSNGDPARIANQPWDDSVKSLTRYPDVLKWMDHNLEWTTAVGEAFLDQPADVMNSIQRLRAEALAAGNLTNTPQQEVVQEETVIRIVPAQPDVIYVPQYDPDVVYVQPHSRDFGPLLTFGVGFAAGSWLNHDCDWGRRSIYVGQWRPGWQRDRNWDRGDRGQDNKVVNVINIKSDTARQWQPSADNQRQRAQHQRSRRTNARSARADALDAEHELSEPSTPGRERGSDVRAKHIPKPLPPDLTSQGNERIRRNLKDSKESSKTRDQNVPEPTATANAPGESDKLLQGGGQGSDPRKSSKQAQRIRQSNGGASNQTEEVPATVQPDGPQKHQKRVEHSQSSDPQSKSSAQSPNGQKHQQKQARQSAPSFEEPNKPSRPPAEAARHKQDTRRSTPSAEPSKPSQPPPEAARHKQDTRRSTPSAEQNKPSQPEAARDKQDTRRSTPSAEQNKPSQPSDASHGKGKGGGEKKSDKKKEGEKKDKGDN